MDLRPVLTVKPVPLPSRLDAISPAPSPSLISSHAALQARAQQGVDDLRGEGGELVTDGSSARGAEHRPSVNSRLWVVPQGQPDRSLTPAETVRSRLSSPIVQEVWDDILTAMRGLSHTMAAVRSARHCHGGHTHGLVPLVSASPSVPAAVVDQLRLAVLGSLASMITDESRGADAFKSVACDAMMVVLALLSDGDKHVSLKVKEASGAFGYTLMQSHREDVGPMLEATLATMNKCEERMSEVNARTLVGRSHNLVDDNVCKMCKKFLMKSA